MVSVQYNIWIILITIIRDALLISMSCIFIVSTVLIFAFSFVSFSNSNNVTKSIQYNSGFKNPSCLLNFYVTIFTCILCFILLIASLFTEHSTLFSGSMITGYIAVTSLNVIVSKPWNDKTCNFSGTVPVTIFVSTSSKVICNIYHFKAMLFTAATSVYSAIYSTTGIQFLLHFLWYGEEPEEDEEQDFVKDDKALNNSYFSFHIFMMLCSCYITTFFQDSRGWNELGVQAFFLLLTIALYGWSLMAPYVLYWRRFE